MNPQKATEKVHEATERTAETLRHGADATLKTAQQAVSATREAANAQLDKAAAAVDSMQSDIDPTINELAAKAQALAERSINYCAHTGERLRQQVDNYTQATTRYVVDQPAKSMLIAFGSGAALATLLILATRGRNN
ncbi:MAG: hypothetical protein ABS38_00040 [Acidovorax sp. SCN 68-22]|jgi:ElaB/YqjD/DUF883 family membrane-anchored ribosome-binding protein|nr:MAG: hypothetical protein ABS38_00040 [Acidovorax sp. SCN 68-22]